MDKCEGLVGLIGLDRGSDSQAEHFPFLNRVIEMIADYEPTAEEAKRFFEMNPDLDPEQILKEGL